MILRNKRLLLSALFSAAILLISSLTSFSEWEEQCEDQSKCKNEVTIYNNTSGFYVQIKLGSDESSVVSPKGGKKIGYPSKNAYITKSIPASLRVSSNSNMEGAQDMEFKLPQDDDRGGTSEDDFITDGNKKIKIHVNKLGWNINSNMLDWLITVTES